jgi:hypothetical protein
MACKDAAKMRIPADAIIEPEKLTKYLLVRRQINDKSRFLEQLGFTVWNSSVLEKAIRQLAGAHESTVDRVDEWGIFHVVVGDLIGPSGTAARVRLVWVLSADARWRFVTLVPEKAI